MTKIWRLTIDKQWRKVSRPVLSRDGLETDFLRSWSCLGLATQGLGLGLEGWGLGLEGWGLGLVLVLSESGLEFFQDL